METVRIVWTDRRQQITTTAEAIKICSDRQQTGRIIDAITGNKELQAKLRALIDG